MFISSMERHETTLWLTLVGIALYLKLSYVSTAITFNSNSLYKPVVRSPLASKLIFESPKMDNIYSEYTVSSKPLQLRKHRNHSKMKKSKKESRIFYITMPTLTYPRNIVDTPSSKTILKREENVLDSKRQKNIKMKKLNKPSNTITAIAAARTPATVIAKKFQAIPSNNQQQLLNQPNITKSISSNSMNLGESKIYQLARHDINGKPERIQMYHAGSKHHLTPKNFQRNLYFVKKIIY